MLHIQGYLQRASLHRKQLRITEDELQIASRSLSTALFLGSMHILPVLLVKSTLTLVLSIKAQFSMYLVRLAGKLLHPWQVVDFAQEVHSPPPSGQALLPLYPCKVGELP